MIDEEPVYPMTPPTWHDTQEEYKKYLEKKKAEEAKKHRKKENET